MTSEINEKDKQNDEDLSELRAKTGVAPISADAAETCIDVIYSELGKARLWHQELGQIRATIIVNFGCDGKYPLLADKHVENLTAETLMLAVLERLVKDHEELRVMREIAARIPGKDWIKAREAAGYGTQIVLMSDKPSE